MKKAAWVFSLLAAAAVAQGPVFADKLVIFKNGKAIKVKSAIRQGAWLKLEVDDKNYLSVPASRVETVEESAVSARDQDFRPNQVAAGSGGGYAAPSRGGEAGLPPEVPAPSEEVNQDDVQAAMAEEAEARRVNPAELGPAGRRVRGGPVSGFQQGGQQPGLQQGQQNVVPGLQPLTQPNPFPNRRLQQRGFRGTTAAGQPAPKSEEN